MREGLRDAPSYIDKETVNKSVAFSFLTILQYIKNAQQWQLTQTPNIVRLSLQEVGGSCQVSEFLTYKSALVIADVECFALERPFQVPLTFHLSIVISVISV